MLICLYEMNKYLSNNIIFYNQDVLLLQRCKNTRISRFYFRQWSWYSRPKNKFKFCAPFGSSYLDKPKHTANTVAIPMSLLFNEKVLTDGHEPRTDTGQYHIRLCVFGMGIKTICSFSRNGSSVFRSCNIWLKNMVLWYCERFVTSRYTKSKEPW